VFTPVLRDGRLFVDGALVDPVPVEATRALGATFVVAVSVIPPPYATSLTSACQPPLDESWLTRSWRSLSTWLPADVAPVVVANGEEPAVQSAPHSLSMILMRASIVVQSHIAAARLRQHPPDFLIQPDVGTVGVFDFDRAAEAIDAGRRAAVEALPKLRRAIEGAAASPKHRTLRRLVLGRQAA
jgi:NTE family protein